MRQLEYTTLISDLNTIWSNYHRCLISNHYDYCPRRYSHVPICATSGRWQRHILHFMDIGLHEYWNFQLSGTRFQ